MSEFAPPGSNARMTKSQVKKYIRDMKKAQEEAQKKLDEAKKKWELEEDPNKLDELLEKKLEDL